MRILECVFVLQVCGQNWSDREETPKEWNDYRFGFDDLPTPKGCHWFGINHAILSGFGNARAKDLASFHKEFFEFEQVFH